MEYSYEARRENLRRRKKSKSGNYSGKFLTFPSEIVALRFLRILPLTTQPFTLPTRGEKRNLDPPFPPSHGSFKNDCNICYRQQRCSGETFTFSQFFRSGGKSIYKGLLTFWIRYKVFKGGRKFILARLHFGEYLALAIEHNRNAQRQRSLHAQKKILEVRINLRETLRLILTSRIFPRLVFPGFPYSLKTSALNSSCKCHLLKPFLFYICIGPPVEGLHGVNRQP